MYASQNLEGPRESEIEVLRGALAALYELLEEYAPSWYTAEAHETAEHALHGRMQMM